MGQLGDLTKEIKTRIWDLLEEDGFVRKGQVGVADIDGSTFGLTGLVSTTRRAQKTVELNPVVGVHHKEVMDMLAAICTWFPSAKWSATVVRNVGYFSPDKTYIVYKFPLGHPIDKTAADVIDAIRNYGIPWINSHLDLSALAGAVETYCSIDNSAYRLPAIFYLQGEKEKALACTEKYRAKLEHADRFLKDYDRFIAELKKM